LNTGALCLGLFLGGPLGCATTPRNAPLPAWVEAAAHAPVEPVGGVVTHAPRAPAPRAGIAGREPAADLVVAALQGEGARFGTDGSVASLWGYLGSSWAHRRVNPSAVQPGDVLFFQRFPDHRRDCDAPDHVGLVVDSAPDGRVTFLEARGGVTRRSYVDPRMPETRRDERGAIRNSFLRPRRPSDTPAAPLLAGEMLCAAIHPSLDSR
jgi:hypothetical protein